MPKILTNLREEILLVGRDLLSESGYNSFSMRMVAFRCGIGVGTLYNYFPSKEQLIEAILHAEWGIHLRRITQATKLQEDLTGKLTAMYGELWLFLHGLHIWVGGATGIGTVEFRGVQQQRSMVRMQLQDIISSALEPTNEDSQWLADCISRVILSYAAEPERDDDRMIRILERLLG